MTILIASEFQGISPAKNRALMITHPTGPTGVPWAGCYGSELETEAWLFTQIFIIQMHRDHAGKTVS